MGRQQLLEEFRAWNELLATIQQGELEALMAKDVDAFQSLQSMAQAAFKMRESIAAELLRQDEPRGGG